MSTSVEPALPQPGDLFASRYRIASLIGKGGFGAVYQAHDTSLDRDVALKVLVRAADDEQSLARFLREARSSAAISSEHVATVYEVGATGDGPYIVMELLRGCDLQDELDEQRRLAVGVAVDYVLQAALGIAHAHARGIIHRDLKPRNLFLAERDDGVTLIKVLDFGIAKSTSTDLTQSGATLGTPRYMAPEQLRSARAVDARTDVWALGVVLYELVTGKAIFDGESATQMAVSIVVDPHIRLRARDADLSGELEAVIDRCLEKEPQARYPDVHQLAVALAPFASETGKALIPRIERALGDRASGVIARGTAETLEVTPAKVRADAETEAVTPSPSAKPTVELRRGEVTTGARGEVTPSRRAPDNSPTVEMTETSHATNHSSRTTIAALLIAAAAIAFGVAMWLRGRPDAPTTSDATRVAIQPDATSQPPERRDAAALADTAELADATTIVAVSEDAAVVVRDANVRVPVVDRPVRPTATEIEGIETWCQNKGRHAPTFLVPNNDGPLALQCGRVSRLGCAGIARGCTTRPVSDEERRQCRDFADTLRTAEICK